MEKETERSNERRPRIPGSLRDGKDILSLAGVFKVNPGEAVPVDLWELMRGSRPVVVLVYHKEPRT